MNGGMFGQSYGASSWEDLLQLLGSYGVHSGTAGQDATWENIGNITSENILSGMGGLFNISDPSDLFGSGEIFPTFGKNLIKGSTIGNFSNLMKGTHNRMIPGLISSLSGTEAKKTTGGFAGSGAAKRLPQTLLSDYQKQMGSAYSTASQSAQANRNLVAQQIQDWVNTAQQFIDPTSTNT